MCAKDESLRGSAPGESPLLTHTAAAATAAAAAAAAAAAVLPDPDDLARSALVDAQDEQRERASQAEGEEAQAEQSLQQGMIAYLPAYRQT